MFSGAETIKNRRNYWLEDFNDVLNLRSLGKFSLRLNRQ
jgi:hypothetical protein